eukprot:5687721-Pyramimonas_sp.AAC.1
MCVSRPLLGGWSSRADLGAFPRGRRRRATGPGCRRAHWSSVACPRLPSTSCQEKDPRRRNGACACRAYRPSEEQRNA